MLSHAMFLEALWSHRRILWKNYIIRIFFFRKTCLAVDFQGWFEGGQTEAGGPSAAIGRAVASQGVGEDEE